ncbi:FAD-dependent oxidoreductase [Georgenia subflava]|uniref:FAD-dependent oxidoreductase n=1 Tax=Georgenia subflava TaxID=1622177 RepID=A0A6N7EDT6_9MICO|nr:NAD(P)/FAD-dependent oxidoreductase [Georgenia subflava]MPV35501.1 FAD-dependent oxidoreductase [Georgenia subflava]
MTIDFSKPEVVVAGAGPVGMTTALMLARSGVSVTVLEAGPDLSTESRASTFHPPTLEMLDELGLADDLRAQGIDVPAFQHRDRKEGLIAEFDLGTLAEETRFPFRVQCEQSKLTRIILEKLRDLDNVDVRFDATVSDVRQDADSVTVSLADGRTVTSTYLVGADGASSAVRRSLGVGFEGETYPERYLVISTTEDIKAWMPDISYVNYISDPSEWVVLLRTPQHWRAMFPVREGMSDDDALRPDNVQRLMRTIGERPGGWPILHTTLYRVHQRVADSYRVGRVFLAGDAAHINNPLGGLGMNSGIHDAYLLADLLVRHIQGRIDDAGLDEYDSRRRDVSRRYVAVETDKNWRRIRERDEAQRQHHFAELREIAADPITHHEHVRKTCMVAELAGAR